MCNESWREKNNSPYTVVVLVEDLTYESITLAIFLGISSVFFMLSGHDQVM